LIRRAWLPALPLIVAAIVHLPPLALPIVDDDVHTLHQAALTWHEPARLLEPWMGGVFRILPKLYFVGLFQIVEDAAPAYRCVNLALHLACLVLLMRLLRRMGLDERATIVAGVLFGAGFGGYLRAVFQISNATLLGAALFLLVAVDALTARRYLRAGIAFVLAALCHEVVLVAPLLYPWLSATARAPGSPPPVARVLSVALSALGALALIPAGVVHEIAARTLAQTWFFLFPINTPGRMLRRLDAPDEVLAPLVTVATWLATERTWIGLVLLAGAVLALRRRRNDTTLGVLWTYAFLVPPAWLIVTSPELGPLWEHGWLERRYLYVPGMAVSALVGAWLAAAYERRRRGAQVALAVLVAWIVTMDVVTWDNYRRLSQTGKELERRARLRDVIEELEQRP